MIEISHHKTPIIVRQEILNGVKKDLKANRARWAVNHADKTSTKLRVQCTSGHVFSLSESRASEDCLIRKPHHRDDEVLTKQKSHTPSKLENPGVTEKAVSWRHKDRPMRRFQFSLREDDKPRMVLHNRVLNESPASEKPWLNSKGLKLFRKSLAFLSLFMSVDFRNFIQVDGPPALSGAPPNHAIDVSYADIMWLCNESDFKKQGVVFCRKHLKFTYCVPVGHSWVL